MAETLKKKKLGKEGFTLLEVLIAVVVLAFGLLAIGQMQIIAIRFNAQSRDATEATTLAKDALEFFKTISFNDENLDDTNPDNNGDLTDEDPDNADHIDANHPFNSDDTPVGKFGLLWNVADGVGIKSVMVIVSWLSGPNRILRQVQFPTVIANPNP